MGVTVEVTVPPSAFALPEAFPDGPADLIRAVRVVAHGSRHAMPYLWVQCPDATRLRRAVTADPTVRDCTVLGAADGRCFLGVEWGPRVRALFSALRREGAFVLAASGYDDAWHVRIYFPDHDSVSTARECCAARGVAPLLDTASVDTGGSAPGTDGLTACQHETLVRAYELGYYDVPRGISQAALAEDLGITHQALSERLRRAHGTLVERGLPQSAHRGGPTISPRSAPEPPEQ